MKRVDVWHILGQWCWLIGGIILKEASSLPVVNLFLVFVFTLKNSVYSIKKFLFK